MANVPTTPPASDADTLLRAAAVLRGETTVAKAAPVEDDAKETEVAKAEDVSAKTEDVAKAENPFEKKDDKDEDDKTEKAVAKALAVFSSQITDIVASALAPVQAELTEVRKSLGVVQGNTEATMAFQSATTTVLTGLTGEVAEQKAVAKAVASTVEDIANQPAGRKAQLQDVQKSVAAQPTPVLDLQPLRDWSASEQYPLYERTAFIHRANLGDFTDIPTDVRKAMGVN